MDAQVGKNESHLGSENSLRDGGESTGLVIQVSLDLKHTSLFRFLLATGSKRHDMLRPRSIAGIEPSCLDLMALAGRCSQESVYSAAKDPKEKVSGDQQLSLELAPFSRCGLSHFNCFMSW